ncbi:succinylglutamate desuccinylase [Alteromonas sediminis]|uniref:Succinylglutamate desuccinylase n=1 Tax=Alteromonas sediminis TaxID=2259342 RepID=A0A3N5Y204_9ALTE|nr:succinylglutamate desuccinylase/aspartoacylase family protein [Alteromonas sediminis]RPJ66656.1 succinylglutamate desuccinylase [Alteromonas sediminis]
MSGIQLRSFTASSMAQVHSFDHLLTTLGGPCEIVFRGIDDSRVRVLTTLLHGNEPSGLRAIYRYLKTGEMPAVTTVCIIASLSAALTAPQFYYRMLPGQADLNRCFTHPPDGLQGALATAIRQRILTLSPEAVVDIHNTSGSGPAFCVTTNDSDQNIALASLFCQRVITTDIQLGSLMEQDFDCPIITFEAGGSQDNQADELAFYGLKAFMNTPRLDQTKQDMERLTYPRRLELQAYKPIVYASKMDTTAAITMRSDIEHHNFGTTPADTQLGWLNDAIESVLKLDSQQRLLSACFEKRGFELYTKVPMRLFMVTTRADIAASDCLFYFQHPPLEG